MNQIEIIHVCAGANERFMIGATAAFAGIALNAKPETVLQFHIFTEGVKPETVAFMQRTLKRLHERSEVVEYVCDDKLLEGLPYWAGSRLPAARVFYPYLMKDVDWALYVDCDVLYFASPEKHWSYRDEAAYACVIQEEDAFTRYRERDWSKKRCGAEVPDAEYFNSGIMLFNLKKCREDKIPEKVQQFYKDFPDVVLPDQTAMNVLFNGHKKMLPAKYDRLQIYISDEKLAERPVVHFVSGNPWLPKLGVVANGRFDLWHRFCDKFIWQKEGASYKYWFNYRILLIKRGLNLVLRIPIVGSMTAYALQLFGLTSNGQKWRKMQVGNDVSSSVIDKVLNESSSNKSGS